MAEGLRNDLIFNSPFETGLRSICILVAGYSEQFDIQQMLAFDHLVVHSGDMPNGPASLHPNILQRNGELLVRRPLVQNGLALMECKNLVVAKPCSQGILYTASEFAPTFIKSLENEYIKEIQDRSSWAVRTFRNLGPEVFIEVFNTAFDRWSTEFQVTDLTIGTA